MRRLNEQKQARIKQFFNGQVDRKVSEIEDLNDLIQPKLERLRARKDLMSDSEYKAQLKNLMLQENEKKGEIEAKLSEAERNFHEQLMVEYIDKQKLAMIKLAQDIEALKNSVLNPDKIKDKLMKSEIEKLN